MIVVDASAILELLLRTAAAESISARVFAPGATLHAPHLIDIEVLQVLRRHEATREITPARARDASSDLQDLPLVRYAHDVLLRRIWELRPAITAYDAAYVALAEALDAPLLTCDAKLARAASHRVRVDLVTRGVLPR